MPEVGPVRLRAFDSDGLPLGEPFFRKTEAVRIVLRQARKTNPRGFAQVDVVVSADPIAFGHALAQAFELLPIILTDGYLRP